VVIAFISAFILLVAVVTGAMRWRMRGQSSRLDNPQDQYKRSVKKLQGGGIHPGGQDIDPNNGYRIHGADGGGSSWVG
jgi:hypothetical protein